MNAGVAATLAESVVVPAKMAVPAAFDVGAELVIVAALGPKQLPLEVHVKPEAQHCPPNEAAQEAEDAAHMVAVPPATVIVVVLVV
jgi:hypothetical protein